MPPTPSRYQERMNPASPRAAAGEAFVDDDGELVLIADFIPPDQTARLFEALKAELSWQEETIVIASRPILVPRLVCWYGDSGATYRYSGVRHDPLPWTPTLAHLREAVERRSNERFNSVLGNLYRSGTDSMGWHADKEKELGIDPVIASLSLGATRRFRLRHNRTREQVELSLTDGSLLIMGGRLQHCWRHCVPKDPAVTAPRINLTFRLIREP